LDESVAGDEELVEAAGADDEDDEDEASAFEPSVDEAADELALEPLPPPESDPDFFG